ncbi:MAG TPA: hypothetical protein VN176_11255 [Verrucomicrobiae bacterium]|jgi:hypothetical protein|nr:hypothetical protein [Verrucomicrobiae bacterium]
MFDRNAKVMMVCLLAMLCAGEASGQARVTQAVLGLGTTEKYEIVNPTSEFKPDTPKIYCAWKVEGAKSGTPVRGVWIAVDVGSVAPPNYKIDEATFTPPIGSPDNGSFALSKPNTGFPPGKYRLEIYLDKTLAKTLSFTVKGK